jgi:hypothetical protein
MARYKYLSYMRAQYTFPKSIIDLVEDEVFVRPDGRIPLLILTQYNIIPSKGMYSGQPKYDYYKVNIFRHQVIALLRRGYFAGREASWIEEYFVDDYFIENFEFICLGRPR